ncbi:hypothetical protein Q8A67_008455 [Cirrhinus molitorella]|uniref:Uncharacterized protein n=1 Tax=Cirrhinus molitorella TaxID=172907 RepID=A0AA88Q4S8_9TELE|nr:hypothetical protein Q8A67_008455 [Cirrhinus molitorella]
MSSIQKVNSFQTGELRSGRPALALRFLSLAEGCGPPESLKSPFSYKSSSSKKNSKPSALSSSENQEFVFGLKTNWVRKN